MAKRRDFTGAEILNLITKKYQLDEALLILDIKEYLKDYLSEDFFRDIGKVSLRQGVLTLEVTSALLKNDLQMRRSQYLQKLQERFGVDKITALEIR